MQEGLLWLDNSPKRDLAEKVARAADRYAFKFGRRPNLCYVNPAMLPALGAQAQVADGSAQVDGVRVVPAANVLKHHFWIGEEDREAIKEVA